MCIRRRKIGTKYSRDETLKNNDKYFFIGLYAEREDGTDDYIRIMLIKNFNHMVTQSNPAIATCYVIGLNEQKVPYLHGIIRFDTNSKYRVSTKSPQFKNIITSMDGKFKNLRHFEVDNKTKYHNNRYETKFIDIKTRYDLMFSIGKIYGNSFDELLS
jgi:hypothetical protein